MKNRRTAIVSGLLAAVCMVSAVLQPLAVSAAAVVPPSYPGISEVREQLDEDEIVTAVDITVEAGSGFDIGKDRTGFTIPDESKVSIVFDEAVDKDGREFSLDRAADYSAKYHVDLNSGHPSYRIIRTVTVKESVQGTYSAGAEAYSGGPAGTESVTDVPDPAETSVGNGPDDRTEKTDPDTEDDSDPLRDSSSADPTSGSDGFSEEPAGMNDGNSDPAAASAEKDTSSASIVEDSVPEEGTVGDSSTEQELEEAWTRAEEALIALTESTISKGRFRLFAAYPGTTNETEWVVIDCAPGRITYSTQGYPETPVTLYGTPCYNANGVEYSMYCITPDAPSTPPMGSRQLAARLVNPTMRKLLYYSYLAPGYNASQEVRDLYESLDYTDFNERSPYAYAHLAMGLAFQGISGRGNWAAGLTARTIGSVERLYNGLSAMPNPPDAFETFLIPHSLDLIQDMAYWKPLRTGEGYLLKRSADSSTSGNSRYSLQGAVYGVYTDEACSSSAGTLTTGADGRSNTLTLNAGTYYVRETTAPKGFRKDTKVYSMVVTAGEATELSVKDEPEKTPLKLLKKSADGGTLPVTGTAYTVYRDADCKDPAGTLKVKADGTSNILELLYGTYYVKETKAAAGYQVDPSVHKVTLKTSETYTLELTDKVVRGGVHLEKWDEELKAARAQGDASLKGTVVTITSENDYEVEISGKTFKKGEVVLTLKSDEKGVMKSSEDALPCGSYSFRETAAPEGYRTGSTISGTFKIGPEDAGTLKELAGKGPKDPVIRGGVKIRKQDSHYRDESPQGDASLAGAEYALINVSKAPVLVDGKEYKNGEIVKTLTTDAKGTAQTEADALPYGSYKVVEKKAPAGYLLNGEWSRSFTVREEGKIVDLTAEPCDDKVIRGGVSVRKHDKELDVNEALGGASLKGIEFTVRNASGERVYVMGIEYGKGDVVARLVTDEEGKASLPADSLPYGTYTITETAVNGSYLLSDGTARSFKIRKDGETVAAGTDGKELVFRDQVVRNDIRFNKIADNSNARMQSIAFKVTNTTTGEAHVIVTDKNGSYRSAAHSNPHTELTNANDAVLEGHKDGDVIRTEELDAKAGTWFGFGRKGSRAEADDSLGAFPYGEYTMEELRCENNQGYDLISIHFFIDEDSTEESVVDLGTITDDETMPEIATMALDSRTKEHIAAAEDVQIIDTVHCMNLVPGRSYILRASLVDEYGAVLRSAGEKVSGEAFFTASSSAEDVKVELGSFDPAVYEGRTVTVFEKLYEKKLIGTGRLLASHEEIDDEDQQVRIPKIRTNAEDLQTKSHTGSIGKAVKIKDTVTYEGLLPGKEYTVSGTLHVKGTGDVLKDAGGDPVTEKRTFTPAEASGSVELIFTIDSRLLRGQTVVAFEELKYKGIDVAVHADINDRDQSIDYPEIMTVLHDKDTGKHEVQADSRAALTDFVSYKNLPADGKTAYIMTGTLILKPAAKDGKAEVLMEDGKPVTVSVRFTPESMEGKIALAFMVDASLLAGREVVAFERCTDAATGALVASHEDIDDEGQTVKFINIRTKAEAEDTGIQETQAWKKTVFIDHVTYTGLTPGKEYTLKGKLMLSDTGRELMVNGSAVTSEVKFKPDKADGVVDMTFTFDSSAAAGKRVVTFEDLYDEDVKIASHADITDKDQTVSVIAIGTKAEAEDTGTQETQASGKTVIIDHVSYSGLTAGREYTLKGNMMLADTGKALTVNGKAVTAGLTFKPEKPDGIVDMAFTFDSSALAGQRTVVFEDLYNGKVKTASHADISDEGQTVKFIDIGTRAEAEDTGTQETQASEKTVFIDHVTYEGLTTGKEYTLKGQLMLAETGKALLVDGKPVTSELTFKPDKSDGIVDMTFVFDSRAVAGKKVVTFEDLYDEKVKVAAHADITDRDQSVNIIRIGTKAEAEDTGTQETQAGKKTVVIDHISYAGLTIGKEYTVKGRMMLAETGKALTVDGKAVASELKFRPETTDGIVDMVFTLDSTSIAGKRTVVFEDLYDGKVKIASHADITDEGQAVTFINIATKAEAKDTGTQETQASEQTVIIDHVTYTGLTIGKEYTVKGQLMLAETGKALLVDGKPVTSELKFKPDKSDGIVDMTFVFDSRAVAGKKVVTFEDLYDEKVKIAVHADITDKDQSVDIVEIGTRAEAKDSGTQELQAGRESVIIDHVSYKGLTVGKEYTVKGRLMLAGTGEALAVDGRPVTSELKFRPEKADGIVDMTFVLDSTAIAGQKMVVFEELFDKKVRIASHADITDEGQTVRIINIGTRAEAKDTGTQETQASEQTVLIDHVTYTGLIIGKEYTLKGQLMLAETGKALLIDGRPVTSELKFKPDKVDGVVDMTFTFDSRAVAGKKVVTFEDLYDENVKIAAHADITDEDQSVNIVKIGTKAEAKDTGTNETQEAGQTVIIDHVTYSGLTAGKEYTLTGQLMLAETGKVLTIDGRNITSELKFKPDKADGTVDMTFTFDSTVIAGKKTVVFEDLYAEGVKVASHADITDKEQSVEIRKKPTPTPTPVTRKTPTPTPTMRKTPTPVPPTPGRTTTTTSPVKTGDTSQPVLWILLGAGSIIIVASMFLKKRNP